MTPTYREIDLRSWARALHCQIFRDYAEPQYCVTFELDVTGLVPYVRARGLSFTKALIFLTAQCANQIEAFRLRFLDGKVVLYDWIDTAFTELNPETELFKVVRVPMQNTLEEYVALAVQTAERQKAYFTGPLGNDVFQFSPFPWVAYTHISHTISGKKDAATPLFDWGRYIERGGRLLLPFSVQVHHSFVDGVHIGTLADALQRALNRFESQKG